ncbi:MAG: phosphoglycerate dehydrogenase [Desulfarculaceae bacterium]|jgi:D-3-phosphoglycerate dehydrogenase
MPFNIISTSPTFGHYVLEPLEFLRKHDCKVDLIPLDERASQEELMTFAKDYDAMIIGLDDINRRVIEAAKKLKVVTKHGAGIDNIDVKAATQKGIIVNNAPGANSDAVADLTMGLFLSLARRIPYADRVVKEGEWPRIIGSQVSSKILGIVGTGEIGKKVAKRALGLDMQLLLYDLVEDEELAALPAARYVELDELISASDYVSLHVPLTDNTRNMIAARELSLMKPGAYLVNVARGGVVDEAALFEALEAQKIAGAACDVFTAEPAHGNPLLSLNNLLATPHMGMYTQEALILTGMICAQDIVAVLEGRAPKYSVNSNELLAGRNGR